MGTVRVVTDSACDLTAGQADEHGIVVVPLTIRFGSEELVDRDQLSTKEFWDRVMTGNTMPATAAPSPGAFRQAFEDAADGGADGVLCINLSSELSATYQSAVAAADSVAERIPVSVLDSRTVTLGQGLLVLAAAELAAAGHPLSEITAQLDELQRRTHVFGVVASLDFLRKGGRIGGAAHLVGSLLSIKPVIEVRGGVVAVESKQRTRARSLQYLAGKALGAGRLERLAVANGAAQDIDEVLQLLAGATPVHELIVSDLGPVVGSHTGPGTVGVCFQLAP